jgi:hypothetical protein
VSAVTLVPATLKGKTIVEGFVRGSRGKGLAQASVAIIDAARELKDLAVTDARGYFELRDQPPGRYFVAVEYRDESNNWASQGTPDFDLGANQSARVDFVLFPAPLVAEIIEERPPWDDHTTSTGTIVDRDHINNVPSR